MSILSAIARSLGLGKGQVRTQNAVGSQTKYSEDVLQSFGLVGSAAGQMVTPLSAMRVAAVFACVQRISGAIMTLPVDCYLTDGEIPVKMPRDDLWYKLNEQPSAQFTAASHWEGVASPGSTTLGVHLIKLEERHLNAIRRLSIGYPR